MADDTKTAVYERKQDGFRVGPCTVADMEKLAGFDEGEWDELPPIKLADWTPPAAEERPAGDPTPPETPVDPTTPPTGNQPPVEPAEAEDHEAAAHDTDQ